MSEAILRDITARQNFVGIVYDQQAHKDIATLLRFIHERDAIIHDLQLDQGHLARLAVEEFIAKAIAWATKSREKYRHLGESVPIAMGATVVWLQEQQAAGTAPDPLPPDQARAEAERLRLENISLSMERDYYRAQIAAITQGCGSHSCRVSRPTGQGNNGPCRCANRLLELVSTC